MEERIAQAVKMGLKACSQQNEKNRSFPTKASFKLLHNMTRWKTRKTISFNEEEISTISSVNDLLDQLLENETSEDKIMHDQVGQNEFENSDEDQEMQEDDIDYSSVRDRSRSPTGRNTGERQREQNNLENQTITRRSTRPTRGIKPIHFREM